MEEDKVISFTSRDTEEFFIVLKYDPKITVLSEENTTDRKSDKDLHDLILYQGDIFNSLPHEYKEKVLKGERFEIEVTTKTYINYNVK